MRAQTQESNANLNMKTKIFSLITFLLIINQIVISQNICPYNDFHGKWKNEDFGIDISCGKITILDKLNNWILSEKRKDTYYLIEPIIKNEQKNYIGGIRSFAIGNIITKERKAQKIPTMEYRIVKLKLNEDGTLSFTISEKSVTYANMSRANWTAILEDENLREKTFIFTKYLEK